MPVNSLKASAAARPAASTAAAKVTAPFDQTKAALANPRVKEALAGMQGQSPKQLAKSIETQLPELATPMKEMIKLLNRPAQLTEALPRPAAEKLANSGWAMLDKLVNLAKPTVASGNTWKPDTRSAEAKHNQLVNLVKSELGH